MLLQSLYINTLLVTKKKNLITINKFKENLDPSNKQKADHYLRGRWKLWAALGPAGRPSLWFLTIS